MDDLRELLSRQIGPFTLGVWLVILVGGYALSVAFRRFADDGADDGSSSFIGRTPLPGNLPRISGGTLSAVDDDADYSPGPRIDSNEEWERAAVRYLEGTGTLPTEALEAISRYLSGRDLSESHLRILDRVLSRFGTPPEGAPPILRREPPPPTQSPPSTNPPGTGDGRPDDREPPRDDVDLGGELAGFTLYDVQTRGVEQSASDSTKRAAAEAVQAATEQAREAARARGESERVASQLQGTRGEVFDEAAAIRSAEIFLGTSLTGAARREFLDNLKGGRAGTFAAPNKSAIRRAALGVG